MNVLVLLLILVVIAAVAVAAWMFLQKRRTEQLREGFGPEYERTVREAGDRGRAESELQERRKRVEKLQIRELAPEQRARFADAWRATQTRFVDDPPAAIGEADGLVGEAMQARGYPVGDFEQRTADISVDHPQVVTNYRAAHAIAQAQERGEANTEDLRQGMVHYRALFEELLGTQPAATNGHQRPDNARTEAQR